MREIGSLVENENALSFSPRCRFPNPEGFSSFRFHKVSKKMAKAIFLTLAQLYLFLQTYFSRKQG
jgi:hypothetical protein